MIVPKLFIAAKFVRVGITVRKVVQPGMNALFIVPDNVPHDLCGQEVK